MNIKIVIDNTLEEDEINIRCKSINEDIIKIQNAIIIGINNEKKNFIFYKDDKEFYFSLDKILFFETDGGNINAHTKNDIYYVKYKLYELEEILPGSFMRVSKSTILNISYVYSITKSLTAASLVEFENTHKKVYVSRNYIKPLKIKLEEKRLNYEKK